jgi:hypothetical protein
VPRRLSEIQSTPPQGLPALTSTFDQILVVTMPRVAETFKSVIDKMTYGTDFKLINLLHTENANFTYEDLKNSIDKSESRWNIHLISYDTLTSRAKPSCKAQLSHCSWSFGIFGEFHQDKTKNRIGWRIAMNTKIGFTLQITATL